MEKISQNFDGRTPVAKKTKKDDQGFWFFFFTLIFIAFALFFAYLLISIYHRFPTGIPVFDFILLILASFRLTHLFVYDRIMEFVRHFFLEKKKGTDDEGMEYTEYYEPENGPMKTLWHLANCPWCAGVWFSLLLVFLYYVTPYAWFFILIFAVAGVSTVVQLFANWLGSVAKNTRLQNEAIEKEAD